MVQLFFLGIFWENFQFEFLLNYTFGENERRCQGVRIVLGAVAPTPIRARKAEAVMEGQLLTETLAEKAGEIAAQESKPISDVRSSADYRRAMVGAMTKRALLNAAVGPAKSWVGPYPAGIGDI